MTILHWLNCAAQILLMFMALLTFAAVFWALAIVVGLPVVAVLSVVVLFRGRKTEVPPSKPDFMELAVGSAGHVFIFIVRDRKSLELLLPSVMLLVADRELPFDDDHAVAVLDAAMYGEDLSERRLNARRC